MANQDARLEVRIDSALLARLPRGRGRSVFVREALEAALADPGCGSVANEVDSSPEPVSPRAPSEVVKQPDYLVDVARMPELEKPTVQQLAGRNGVSLMVASRWLEAGVWRRYW